MKVIEDHLSWRKDGIFLLVCAGAPLILLANLGVLPLWGSEGRWAVIARSMLTSGDILNPLLGQSPYWDKPLLSYWQILPGAYLLGGVTEFSARLPSAIWALVMLALTYDLARWSLDARTGVLSAAVLCTSLGFVIWGRNAQVEMTNAAIILLSLWYLQKHRTDHGYAWVFVFGVILALGANMKGLTAYAIPIVCVMALSAAKWGLSWLPPTKVLISAAIFSLCMYLLISFIAALVSSSWEPFRLIWRENVVRFFQAYDHKDTFYLYFYRIFDLAAPWSLFLPPALFAICKELKQQKQQLLEILIIFGAIFLFFTLSSSRRPYYLLPILPYASILIANHLINLQNLDLTPALDRITRLIGFILSLILTAPLLILIFRPQIMPQGIKDMLPLGSILFLSAVFMAWGFVKRRVPLIIFPACIIWGCFVLAVVPDIAKRPDTIRANVALVSGTHRPVAFLGSDDAKSIFYLNRPYAIAKDINLANSWAMRTNGILITDGMNPGPHWECLKERENWGAYTLKGGVTWAMLQPTPQMGIGLLADSGNSRRNQED